MARKADLRRQRTGTVINLTSKQQESLLGVALTAVVEKLTQRFGVRLYHERDRRPRDVVATLRESFPDIPFHYSFETSAMRPDRDGKKHAILIVEVKNQGTNDLRALEGKTPQAKGNAIERLGRNVIGFRKAMLPEAIMPFVCFGYGCDFADTSSILDRVVTIAMFGPLNESNVVSQGEHGRFNRGSFFFREEKWTDHEMASIMYEVGKRSLHYYFAKYGEQHFRVDE